MLGLLLGAALAPLQTMDDRADIVRMDFVYDAALDACKAAQDASPDGAESANYAERIAKRNGMSAAETGLLHLFCAMYLRGRTDQVNDGSH